MDFRRENPEMPACHIRWFTGFVSKTSTLLMLGCDCWFGICQHPSCPFWEEKGKSASAVMETSKCGLWFSIKPFLGSAWYLDFIDAEKGSLQLFQNPSTGEPHLRKKWFHDVLCGEKNSLCCTNSYKKSGVPSQGRGAHKITSQNVLLIPCSEWGNWESRSGMQAFPTFPIFSSFPNSLK